MPALAEDIEAPEPPAPTAPPEVLTEPPEEIQPVVSPPAAAEPAERLEPAPPAEIPEVEPEPEPSPEVEPEISVTMPADHVESAIPSAPEAETPAEIPTEEEAPVEAEPEAPPEILTPEQKLELPRKELASGNVENAVVAYAESIKDRDLIDLVIDDLKLALERQPENPSLWQTLGDAYMNKDQLTEAIEAYRRGMESA
jgi:hypothetical protein